MKIIKSCIKLLLLSFLLFMLSAQTIIKKENNMKPLRSVLLEFAKQNSFDIIFQDDLIDNKIINLSSLASLNTQSLLALLEDYDLILTKHSSTYILRKSNKIKTKKYYTKIEQTSSEEETNIHITPKIISTINPSYPLSALKNRIEGDVTIKILVDTTGNVGKSLVDKTSGFRTLDSAAVACSYNLIFSPATYNGIPTRAWVLMVFKYHLKDK